ncbi:MAG: histidinol dehydrogenase [Proteobacteria bacterium]|nr:histidinol dehydrogenase [Pseudomonadota bacterium]
MPRQLDSSSPDFEAAFVDLLAQKRETDADVNGVVADIIANIRRYGDQALFDYTDRFDRVALSPETVRVRPEEILAAREACSTDALRALGRAHDRIRAFHERQLPSDIQFTDNEGVSLGYRWNSVESVGLYVPGGTAAYPSSVLMNAIPARAAGVDRIVMVVPTPDGQLNPLVLAAASTAGVGEIYKIGGAQAIAALAFGTESIAPVVKIVGPGNAYVATAKRQVFGTVGIDMIAGPSEILVLADNKNDPAWIAADLLSQAEHDTAAQSILVTDDKEFAAAVERAIEVHLQMLTRSEIASESWEANGAIILVPAFEDAVPLINRLAPEHLELALDSPERISDQVRNAGAIFLGRYTPEAIGDYIAGTNHVLPTARAARFSSGLSVLDFMKRTSLVECDQTSFEALAPDAETLAHLEGLGAHALSMEIRRRKD